MKSLLKTFLLAMALFVGLGQSLSISAGIGSWVKSTAKYTTVVAVTAVATWMLSAAYNKATTLFNSAIDGIMNPFVSLSNFAGSVSSSNNSSNKLKQQVQRSTGTDLNKNIASQNIDSQNNLNSPSANNNDNDQQPSSSAVPETVVPATEIDTKNNSGNTLDVKMIDRGQDRVAVWLQEYKKPESSNHLSSSVGLAQSGDRMHGTIKNDSSDVPETSLVGKKQLSEKSTHVANSNQTGEQWAKEFQGYVNRLKEDEDLQSQCQGFNALWESVKTGKSLPHGATPMQLDIASANFYQKWIKEFAQELKPRVSRVPAREMCELIKQAFKLPLFAAQEIAMRLGCVVRSSL